MSLLRIALRMTAVKALFGNTMAGENVLDSEIGILGEDDDGLNIVSKKPFIAVYTDEAEVSPDPQRMFHGNGSVILAIEYGYTSQMSEIRIDPGTGEEYEAILPDAYTIPVTARMPEIYLDVLGRQIRDALATGTSEAAKIFRSLFLSVSSGKCERAASDRNGERVAAHRMTFILTALPDPQVEGDVPANAPMARFFELLDAGDAVDQNLATLFRDLIPATPDDLEHSRLRVGQTLEELRALGLGPISGADDTSEFETVDITIEGSQDTEVTADV